MNRRRSRWDDSFYIAMRITQCLAGVLALFLITMQVLQERPFQAGDVAMYGTMLGYTALVQGVLAVWSGAKIDPRQQQGWSDYDERDYYDEPPRRQRTSTPPPRSPRRPPRQRTTRGHQKGEGVDPEDHSLHRTWVHYLKPCIRVCCPALLV